MTTVGLSCTGNQVSRSALKIARDEGAGTLSAEL